ncbi:MAG: hypothetical protein NTY38_12260 [Acidobacteria bacterium]|nr:hypothetical protein [Acidobacteriota bacterium]
MASFYGSSGAQVGDAMNTYGPLGHWVEDHRSFKKVDPGKLRIDPVTKKLVADTEKQ